MPLFFWLQASLFGGGAPGISVFDIGIVLANDQTLKLGSTSGNYETAVKRSTRVAEQLAKQCRTTVMIRKKYMITKPGNGRIGSTEREQLSGLIQDLSVTIEQNPEDASAYLGRGDAYRKAGDLAKALADLNQAIHLAPNFPAAYWVRANLYDELKEYEQALADFHHYLTLQSPMADRTGVEERIAEIMGKLGRQG